MDMTFTEAFNYIFQTHAMYAYTAVVVFCQWVAWLIAPK